MALGYAQMAGIDRQLERTRIVKKASLTRLGLSDPFAGNVDWQLISSD
jgi:hypothetical protein